MYAIFFLKEILTVENIKTTFVKLILDETSPFNPDDKGDFANIFFEFGMFLSGKDDTNIGKDLFGATKDAERYGKNFAV